MLRFSTQGADLLSHVKDGSTVYIPDFLKGSYASPSWFPPDNEEKQGAMGAFFGGPANPGTAIPNLHGLVQELATKSEPGTKLAALGLCWGAKVNSNLRNLSVQSKAAGLRGLTTDTNSF